MLGFLLSVCSMVIVLLFLKNKIFIFILWVFLCFIPYFSFVYREEYSDLHYAYEMGFQEILEVWFGIVFVSLVWALAMFFIAVIVSVIFKNLIKNGQTK